MSLEILFEDEHYIAINKPAGMLVHKTRLAKDDEAKFALQELRNQVGYKVYPLHRIDRPTSGVLWFGKSAEVVPAFQQLFIDKQIRKYYLAIVRGYTENLEGLIDHPLRKDLKHDEQEAQTRYWRLGQVEIPEASSARHASSRYSLLKVFPLTGRMHQIRRHFAHARHYIIGDKTHGDNKQNRFFRMHYQMHHMLLHAWQTELYHPITGSPISVEAPLPDYFQRMVAEFGWTDLIIKESIT